MIIKVQYNTIIIIRLTVVTYTDSKSALHVCVNIVNTDHITFASHTYKQLRLLYLVRKRVAPTEFQLIKGHAGHFHNIIADAFAGWVTSRAMPHTFTLLSTVEGLPIGAVTGRQLTTVDTYHADFTRFRSSFVLPLGRHTPYIHDLLEVVHWCCICLTF